MFYGHLDYFQKSSLGGKPNTNPGNRGTPNAHNCWIIYFIMYEDPCELKFVEMAFGWGPSHIWLHTTLEDPWPHYMILEVYWDSIWTLSFGLPHYMVTAFGSCVKWPLIELVADFYPERHKVIVRELIINPLCPIISSNRWMTCPSHGLSSMLLSLVI